MQPPATRGPTKAGPAEDCPAKEVRQKMAVHLLGNQKGRLARGTQAGLRFFA
jgi:hypothetical protein